MPRRVSLPGADELFRATGGPLGRAPLTTVPTGAAAGSAGSAVPAAAPGRDSTTGRPSATGRHSATGREEARAPSGRERHDEKITVYVSPEELVDIERARLTLRAEYGVRADRGRVVREALAIVLADLERGGGDSELVRRLTQG